ncbi:MAG: prephenate dehydrogenase [Candidatus Methylomirabilales bacterium]
MSNVSQRPLFNRIAVIGVGLIGGSLARACRDGIARRVIGLDVEQTHLQHALSLGLVDQADDLPTGVEGADLVVVAVPVGAIMGVVRAIAPHLGAECTVTDVGSVKGDLVAEVEAEIPAGRMYIGGHPIAGTERSGPEAARAGLFRDSLCVLTPTSRTAVDALGKVTRLWEEVGSRVVLMDPFLHDRIFALVSHLPHLVAYALMSTLPSLAEEGDEILRFSAGGLRDFTRIAASDPTMWRDILIRNRKEVLESITVFQKVLHRFEEMIRTQDAVRLMEEFQRAKEMREQLR